jgi:hypothetical protein
MRGLLRLLPAVILVAVPVTSPADEIIPAGTLVQCTLSEPNFSSKTAELGDPVLCHSSPLQGVGRSVFPRGVSIAGQFADYRNPGHFYGKGWMQLSFDRVILPDEAFPLAAKVVNVPHMKVDAQGNIHGRGHLRRDIVLWAFPPFWPVKVLTLPMRGPRPMLKGETRLTLKLMSDVVVPGPAGVTNMRPAASLPSRFGATSSASAFSYRRLSNSSEGATTSPVSNVSLHSPRVQTAALTSDGQASKSKELTFLILNDGTGHVATDYWFEDGRRIRFVLPDGTSKIMPIASLDLRMTIEMNRQRGVEFVIRSQNAEN